MTTSITIQNYNIRNGIDNEHNIYHYRVSPTSPKNQIIDGGDRSKYES